MVMVEVGRAKLFCSSLGNKTRDCQSIKNGGSSQQIVGEKFELAMSTIADIRNDRKKIVEAISCDSPSFSNKSAASFII